MKQNIIEDAGNYYPAPSFRWRDRGKEFHDPATMETRHLFYTLRMIWNHSMPAKCRLEPYKRYQFSPYYTEEYMRAAVINIGRELFKRKDLTPQWKSQLDFMAAIFEPMRPMLEK